MFVMFAEFCMIPLKMTLVHFRLAMEIFDRVNALGASGGVIHGQALDTAAVAKRAIRLRDDNNSLKECTKNKDDSNLI
jgi:hypothetical protein